MASIRVAAHRAGELLRLRLHALDDRHRHHVLSDCGINVEDTQHLFQRLVVIGVRGVSFLPEEFRGSQKHARAQLPSHDVGPLVQQHRQIAPALDPLAEEVADDGLRGRTDDVRLLQLLSAGDGDYRQLRREALHVLGFFVQKTLRDEQRKVNVLMAGGLEAVVKLALQKLPDSVAVGLDDHAAFDNLGGLGHVALQNHVLIPGCKISGAGSNRGFGHECSFV